MKAGLLLVLIILTTAIFSCQKEATTSDYPVDALVLGINSDCGIYAVKILNGLKEAKAIVGPTVGDSIYIAKNLPATFAEGVIVSLHIRRLKADEMEACKVMGPSYTWLFVERAIEEKDGY